MVKQAKTRVQVDSKPCTCCGEVKLAVEFFSDKRLKTGLSSKCKACNRAMNLDWQQRNPDRWKQSYTSWRRENAERVRVVARSHYRRNAETIRARAMDRYYANLEVERERYRVWAKANRGLLSAANAAYFAAKDQRTPLWADFEKIKAVYEAAARRRANGEDVHVDHIIPLRGKLVSGLHVHQNLRVIAAVDNVSKGNRFNPSAEHPAVPTKA